MQVNRQQFLEQGYLVLRDIIPPAQLRQLRADFETPGRKTEDGSGRRNAARTTRPAAIGKPARSRAWSPTRT